MGSILNEQGCICIFSAFYPPHLGGVEIYTRSVALELIEMGHKVCIVTSQLGDEPNIDKIDNLTIIRIPTLPLMNARFPLIKPTLTTKRLLRFLIQMKMKWIIINTRYYPLSHLGLRIAKRKDIRAILLDHSSGPIDSSNGLTGKMLRTYERVVTQLARKKDPACYGVSHKSNTWLKHLGLDACGVIPNAINVQAFLHSASQKDYRNELSLGEDAFLIVFAGRLLADKGVMELCAAVEESSKKHPLMHLAIAGSGPLEAQLSSLKDPHIHRLGKLSQSDLAALLIQSNAMCLPSRYPEGLPTILLEAAAAKNALIVTDNGGTDEVIATPAHGIVLEDGSVPHIRVALERLYDDRNATSHLAAHAQEHVEANLTWRGSAQAIIEACQKSNPALASD